jgi:hypothetical protein
MSTKMVDHIVDKHHIDVDSEMMRKVKVIWYFLEILIHIIFCEYVTSIHMQATGSMNHVK